MRSFRMMVLFEMTRNGSELFFVVFTCVVIACIGSLVLKSLFQLILIAVEDVEAADAQAPLLQPCRLSR